MKRQPKHSTAPPVVRRFPVQLVIMRSGCPLGIAIEIGRTRIVVARERSERWHVEAQAAFTALQAEMYANQWD